MVCHSTSGVQTRLSVLHFHDGEDSLKAGKAAKDRVGWHPRNSVKHFPHEVVLLSDLLLVESFRVGAGHLKSA